MMANHSSAIKRHKQSIRNRLLNKKIKKNIKTSLKKLNLKKKKFNLNINSNEVRSMISVLSRAAKKNVIHRNNAAHKISKIMKNI